MAGLLIGLIAGASCGALGRGIGGFLIGGWLGAIGGYIATFACVLGYLLYMSITGQDILPRQL